MTTVLGEFSKLSKPGGAEIFNDERLGQIAATMKMSEKKVAKIISLQLLHNFSIGPRFLNRSKKLLGTYNTLKDRYLAIVEALRIRDNVEHLEVMQTYLLGKSFYKTPTDQIIRREIQRAILADDVVISFPEIYPFSQFAQNEIALPSNINAQRLFELLAKREQPRAAQPLRKASSMKVDQLKRVSSAAKHEQSRSSALLRQAMQMEAGEDSLAEHKQSSPPSLLSRATSLSIEPNERILFARFFYKHVALYQNGKIFTWRDLAEEWVKKGATRELVSKLEQKLPLYWLRTIKSYATPKEEHPTFQRFVYDKTIKVLEERLQITLDVELQKELLEQMENENFRMNLVFYLGHCDYLLQNGPKKEDPAYQWLLAIRRFLFAQNQFAFQPERASPFFRWVLHTKSLPKAFAAWDKKCDHLPLIYPKKDMDYVLDVLVDLGVGFPGADFRENALELVSILEKDKRNLGEKVLFLLALSSSNFSLVPVKQIVEFFREARFDKVLFRHNLNEMRVFLTEMKAEGQSNLFLPLLCYPHWSDTKVRLAKQTVQQVGAAGMKVEEVLAIFLNVLHEKIGHNMLTAAHHFLWIPTEAKKEAFTGALPSNIDCEKKRMNPAGKKAQEYNRKYGFTPVETFQCYLWILSQEERSIQEKEEIIGRIEVFISCSVEKEFVLSLMQAKIKTSVVVDALKELYSLRDRVMREHADKPELPDDIRSGIQEQMDKIFYSDETQEHFFHVHAVTEIGKYFSSGFLFYYSDSLTPFFAGVNREVQIPFGHLTSLKRMMRGGWRSDSDHYVFELFFVNSSKRLEKHLTIPLKIDPTKIGNPEEFFPWMKAMVDKTCPDRKTPPSQVPEKSSPFEEPVREFLQQFKVVYRKSVLEFAKPNPLDTPAPEDSRQIFSSEGCPKDLASQILEGKQPNSFPLSFDDGHLKKKMMVQCDYKEEDPFCVTLSITLESGKALIFPVEYLKSLTKKEADLQKLLLEQISGLQSLYYEHAKREAPPSESLE